MLKLKKLAATTWSCEHNQTRCIPIKIFSAAVKKNLAAIFCIL